MRAEDDGFGVMQFQDWIWGRRKEQRTVDAGNRGHCLPGLLDLDSNLMKSQPPRFLCKKTLSMGAEQSLLVSQTQSTTKVV